MEQVTAKLEEVNTVLTPIDAREAELAAALNKNKFHTKDLSNAIQTINENIIKNKKNIRDIEAKIEEEKQKLQTTTRTAREEKEAMIAQLGNQIRSLHSDRAKVFAKDEPGSCILYILHSLFFLLLHQCEDDKAGLNRQLEQVELELRNVENDLQRYNREADTAKRNRESMLRQKQDRMSAFHDKMPEILRDIRRFEQERRWTGFTPIGPFGKEYRFIPPSFSLSHLSICEKRCSHQVAKSHVSTNHRDVIEESAGCHGCRKSTRSCYIAIYL